MGSSPIAFHTIDVDFPLEDEARLSAWLIAIAKEESCFIGRLHYHFCSDEHLLLLNKEHLDHDFYTDVITFDQSRLPLINGDVFISIDRVQENAKDNDQVESDELYRVMVHGLLHLMGYCDKSEEERGNMREKETWALSFL